MRDLKKRIEQLSEESVAGGAVSSAIGVITAAMMAAVMTPVIVATTVG